MPLIALLLAYDAIVGEDESGTLLLLLTYPLGRGHILLGKFIGHGGILALATLIGFGCAMLAIAVLVDDVELSLLVWGFLGLAYVLSSISAEKSTAAGLALGVWFFFVLVFDLVLLALLVLSEGQFNPRVLPWLLLLNPADIYRLINLSGFDGGASTAGVLRLGSDLPVPGTMLWLCLLLWVAAPLGSAWLLFRRRAS
jgi:Cu-processing system permease protein